MKTILITGASSGFGKLAIPMLLERGHTVIAGIRGGETRLRSLFERELAAHPGRLLACELHLEKSETFASAVSLVRDRFGGKLDVLVNNAGFGLFGAVEDQDETQLRAEFEVNFFGPVSLTRALLPALRAARGRVLNVSSVAGRFTFPFYGSYSASKFALEAISEGLHYELKPWGIQVGLIEPGGFKTGFNSARAVAARSREADSLYRKRTENFENFLATSDKRLDNPAKVARLIVSLCERRHLPVRNLIGRDANALSLLARLLPDSWRIALQEFFFRKLIFRD